MHLARRVEADERERLGRGEDRRGLARFLEFGVDLFAVGGELVAAFAFTEGFRPVARKEQVERRLGVERRGPARGVREHDRLFEPLRGVAFFGFREARPRRFVAEVGEHPDGGDPQQVVDALP